MVNVALVVEDKSWSGKGICKLVAIVVEDCCWVERYLKAQFFALSVELLSKSGMRAPIIANLLHGKSYWILLGRGFW